MHEIKIVPAGDSAVLVQFGDRISPEINRRIAATIKLIKEQKIEGILDMVPAFCSLSINYDMRIMDYATLEKRLKKLVKMEVADDIACKRVVEIPVCYGGEYGPDLEYVAERAKLSVEEVIRIHSSKEYLIYMLGFMPGFCYLGGLEECLHTPRLANPRVKIPAGSVGIGGAQTGVYPLDSPGGWQLLGQTPVKVYDPSKEEPIVYQAGDYIRFVPITVEQFNEIKAQVEEGNYQFVIHEGGE